MVVMNRQNAKDAKVVFEPDPELDRLANLTIGAAIEVHRSLGPGFLESVYEQALYIEVGARGLAVERQVPIAIDYKGHKVGEARLDLRIEKQLLVEIKAVEALAPIHFAQVISYLRATRGKLGLLMNFNVTTLPQGLKRIVLS
jgi:GxxExxY protein